ncbi:ATP-binding cassette domain-containing protein, partial [Candidatus Poribacteria bacterium]|nr:ATP-binding cassette domain-containing protein [Candidatus Poribacteria bacterium]
MIQVYNVSMSYKEDIEVLHEINFEVKKGEFVFLVGTSGAGKTTILRLLYRELIPTSGHIILAGQNLSQISQSQIPYLRRRMGVIFQDFKLLPNKTVQENIALAMNCI